MIAKRIFLKKKISSSYTRLAEYITNSQGKTERLGTIRVTNCKSNVPEWAAAEIETTQSQNNRTQMDKTYHMLVSFREGDTPSPFVLRQIEERLCKAIGYAEHQRISAVHYDTDHTHLHIAINKIHPVKYTAIEPYYDMPKLGEECEKLEIEFNLARDNHTPKKTQAEGRATDMEKAAGLESMIGWIKRGCLNELLAATSWKALHTVMAANGLKIQPQNNGLIITDGKGTVAKASSVSRLLSKNALEKILGPYKNFATHEIAATAKYKIQPVASKIDTGALWAQYRSERKQNREIEHKTALQQRDRLIAAAKRKAKLKRTGIKLIQGKLAKKVLYDGVSKKLLAEIKKINLSYAQGKYAPTNASGSNTSGLLWHDWLKVKAQEGNNEALAVLRARYERQSKFGNMISSPSGLAQNLSGKNKIDTVTKKGTVHYQISDGVLRDDGNKFRMGDNLSSQALEAALDLAVKRFGKELEIEGSKSFCMAMKNIAANSKQGITIKEINSKTEKQTVEYNQNATTNKKETQSVKMSEDDVAAQQYIMERNQKRQKGLNIPNHRQFKGLDAGKFSYSGIREIESTKLMLLQTSSEMLVMPLDEKTAFRVRGLNIGSPIEITENGIVKTRSQSRGH